jgi:hypothetical protein
MDTKMHHIELQLNTFVMGLRKPGILRTVCCVRRPGFYSGGGVKAVEGFRSPSPGGTTERLGEDEHLCALRRRLSEAVGGLVAMPETPESRRDFVLYHADGELVMPEECPEIWRGKAESGKQEVEIRTLQVEMPEMAESQCNFVLDDADGQLLMRQECPKISDRTCRREGRCPVSVGEGARRRESVRSVGALPTGKSATRQVWKPALRLAEHRDSGSVSECGGVRRRQPSGTTEITESRCDFDLQDTVGELVMSHDCPEHAYPVGTLSHRALCFGMANHSQMTVFACVLELSGHIPHPEKGRSVPTG